MEEENRLEDINKYSGLLGEFEPELVASAAAEAHTKKFYCGLPLPVEGPPLGAPGHQKEIANAEGKQKNEEDKGRGKCHTATHVATGGVALHMAGLGGKFAVVTEDIAVAQTTSQRPPEASSESERGMQGAGLVRTAAAAVVDVVKAVTVGGEAQSRALGLMTVEAQATDPDFATTYSAWND